MVRDVYSTARQSYQRLRPTSGSTELKRVYLSWVTPVTVAFMVWYLLYVIGSNWAPGLMGTQLVGNINVALGWGLLQVATTFGIAWAYQRHSARRLDPLADESRADFEREVAA